MVLTGIDASHAFFVVLIAPLNKQEFTVAKPLIERVFKILSDMGPKFETKDVRLLQEGFGCKKPEQHPAAHKGSSVMVYNNIDEDNNWTGRNSYFSSS